jgi:RHS repeat-associated protein
MQTEFIYDCTPHLAYFAYKFTGKERDAESGLDYFGARYYASSMGRWMSPDWADKPEAVPYSDLENPQSLNLYQYVGNNPLSKADADGHCIPWCTAAIGALVGGGASIAAQEWHNRNDPNAQLNWKQVGAAALGGAVAGGTLGVLAAPAVITTLAGETAIGSGLAVTVGSGAIGGVAGGITERAANGEGAQSALNPSAVVRDAAVGAAAEVVGAGAERGVEHVAGAAAEKANAALGRIGPRTSASVCEIERLRRVRRTLL